MARKRANPFYLSVKPEGEPPRRIGPIAEADIWVEDGEDDLVPIHTSADPTWEELGQAIRDRRLELGIPQKTLAAMAGVSTSYMSDLERGRGAPRAPVVHAIAAALHSYIAGPLPTQPSQRSFRGNPPPLPTAVVKQYEGFHGTKPSELVAIKGWLPGKLTCVGAGIDISYGIIDRNSSKEGACVHKHLDGVKVYRRRRAG